MNARADDASRIAMAVHGGAFNIPPDEWDAHRRGLIGRAVAVDALDLARGPHFHLKSRVAVHVLHIVAVHTVHPLLEVNVEVMHRQPLTRLGEFLLRLEQVGRGVVLLAVNLLRRHGSLDRGPERGRPGAYRFARPAPSVAVSRIRASIPSFARKSRRKRAAASSLPGGFVVFTRR